MRAGASLRPCNPFDAPKLRPKTHHWQFPPKPEDNLLGWITTAGAYDKVSKDLYAVGWKANLGARGLGFRG